MRICVAMAPRGTVSSSVLHPEIAHHAAERALAVGEKDDGGRGERAVGVGLLLPQRRVGALRVERRLRPRDAEARSDRALQRLIRTARYRETVISLPDRRFERLGFAQPLLPQSAERPPAPGLASTRARGVAGAPSWKRRFGLHRHVDADDRLDAGAHDVLLQRLQALGVAVEHLLERNRRRRAMTERTVNGENASKPSAAAGA